MLALRLVETPNNLLHLTDGYDLGQLLIATDKVLEQPGSEPISLHIAVEVVQLLKVIAG